MSSLFVSANILTLSWSSFNLSWGKEDRYSSSSARLVLVMSMLILSFSSLLLSPVDVVKVEVEVFMNIDSISPESGLD